MVYLKGNYQWFIRIGLILIALAGFIFAVGDLFIPQEGNMFKATEDSEAFSELVTGKNFKIWAARGLVGVPLETIGTIALFLGLAGTAREKFGFYGMLLCVLGDVFGISLFVISYFQFPKVGELIANGIPEAATVAAMDSMMPVMGFMFLLTLVGLILFAVAIWNVPDRFPKWSGILVVIGFALLLIQTSYVIQFLANIIWAAAYLWMAIYSWNKIPQAFNDRA